MKIATHNSATGEPGHGLISWLVTPFARCQSKTIHEQLNSGCRLFDLRIRKTNRGWVFAHGLWQSKCTAEDVLSLLNAYDDVIVNITYEGYPCDDYLPYVDWLVSTYRKVTFCQIAYKKPEWTVLKTYNYVCYKSGYLCLDWSSWHTWLPVPWIWKKLYHNHPVFSSDYFLMVDFL